MIQISLYLGCNFTGCCLSAFGPLAAVAYEVPLQSKDLAKIKLYVTHA